MISFSWHFFLPFYYYFFFLYKNTQQFFYSSSSSGVMQTWKKNISWIFFYSPLSIMCLLWVKLFSLITLIPSTTRMSEWVSVEATGKTISLLSLQKARGILRENDENMLNAESFLSHFIPFCVSRLKLSMSDEWEKWI